MLKIKKEISVNELKEMGFGFTYNDELCGDFVFGSLIIDLDTRQIEIIDNSTNDDLDLLFDLIKKCVIEKV